MVQRLRLDYSVYAVQYDDALSWIRLDVGQPLSSIAFTVHARPRAQERAGRHAYIDRSGKARVRAYTPKLTRTASDEIRAAWVDAGAIFVPAETPFVITVTATKQRPDSHLRKDGSPSRDWREIPRTPDCDNTLKLVLDALQPLCIPNDALCRKAITEKRYGDADSLEVRITWA